jgi:hypothetical protein
VKERYGHDPSIMPVTGQRAGLPVVVRSLRFDPHTTALDTRFSSGS